MTSTEEQSSQRRFVELISQLGADSEMLAYLTNAIKKTNSAEVSELLLEVERVSSATPRLLEEVRRLGAAHHSARVTSDRASQPVRPIEVDGNSSLQSTPNTGIKSTSQWFGDRESFSIGLSTISIDSVSVKIIVDGTLVWGSQHDEGVLLSPLRFVSFFALNWDALLLESFPNSPQSYSVVDWWSSISRRASRNLTRKALSEEVQALWHNFWGRHCLKSASSNPTDTPLGEVWFVSRQDSILIDAPGVASKFVDPFEWMHAVESACETVLQEVAKIETDSNSAWQEISRIWRARGANKSISKLIGLYTGIGNSSILERISASVVAANASQMIFHQSEILAAARMRPSSLAENDMISIIDVVESTEHRNVPILDRASGIALSQAFSRDSPPFEQGYALASWLRDFARLPNQVEPFKLISDWGVQLKSVKLQSTEVDAIGYWGSRHGPAILVNLNGIHARTRNGNRSTLAHEICHLLIDRSNSLPLGEVLGGNVSEPLEQRARAFAAELLLPQSVVYERYLVTDRSIHEAAELIQKVMTEFRVSRWIAGFQLSNSLFRFEADPYASHVVSLARYVKLITSQD